MNLLPIGDGSTYINLSKAKEFDLGGPDPGGESVAERDKYYKSGDGVWVRKEAKQLTGQAVSEREAFKAFMSAGRFSEAKEQFRKRFERGSKVTAARTYRLLRFAVGTLAGLLLVAYIAAVVAGKLTASHQISIADLVVIALGVMVVVILIRPEMLSNIQEFGLGGLSVKMTNHLQDLKNTQENQTKELDDLRFTTNLLVTDIGRIQLENLVAGRTSNYQRTELLQDELRRLRGQGLIKSKRNIGDMPAEFDLSEWVERTDRGDEYLRRWNEANR